MAFRSGYVAILGRPNVGKSTLLNRILGEKISIVSEKPQTTRNRIVGIHTTDEAQVVFLDTPGVHKGRDTFNKWMVDQALSTLAEVDVALFVVELDLSPGPGDEKVAQAVVAAKKIGILVGNKCDRVPEKSRDRALDRYLALGHFSASGAVSAETGEGVDKLLGAIIDRLPEGPKYYPEDQLTDRPERFLAAEIVREKLFHLTRQEIPYSAAVTTDEFKEEEKLVRIGCTIFVEKESQKGMVIGKKGSMLKQIGTEARHELERFLATKVMLQLWVKVKPDWSRDPKALAALGYTAE